MNRKTIIILCNFIKGGAGKTTLAVHIAGILLEETAAAILLIDCDPRPDSWKFFTGGVRPQNRQKRISLSNSLDLWWNPPLPGGTRFETLTKTDCSNYDYVVIDTDSPPEDSLTMLADVRPDIVLIPIAESQSHSIDELGPFLTSLQKHLKNEKDGGTNYNPTLKIVPLGLKIEEIKSEVDITHFTDIQIEICSSMRSLAAETRKSLKNKTFIWKEPALKDTKDYFANLIFEVQ